MTYDFTIISNGNDPLTQISLLENVAAQWGSAFVGVVGTPAITTTSATDNIELNGSYDGGLSDAQLIDNSGTNTNFLDMGEAVTIRVVFQINPDAALAPIDANGFFTNQAEVSGVGDDTGFVAMDDSDDPTNATDNDPNADNNPDDPNLIRFPLISLQKQIVGTPVPASSAIAGNFDVTYQFTIENDGSTDLQGLTLTEDLATQFGGAFRGIVGVPTITASTATDDPGINAAYDGTSANANIFDGTASLLQVNETITVQIVVEVDPDNNAVIDSPR